MLTVRCTQKLLKRVSEPQTEDLVTPTTLLGDWYANILFSKPQQILLISERTLLPVVVPAKGIQALSERFTGAVRDVLTILGIAPRLIEQELALMQGLRFGRTINKRILGSLNDFMFHLDCHTHEEPNELLLQRSLRLGEIPCAPIGYKFPTDATRELFASVNNIANAIH
ncbi:MAG: hypothetical protein H6R18_2372 [Proteobacteria bacterium]|nr:hypothetical protein [Pseudomonadota bacterium]